MKMTKEFMSDVQRSGWIIEAVGETACAGRCPRSGCGMVAKITDPAAIPTVRREGHGGVVIGSNEDMRLALRAKRKHLKLTQEEVEMCAGLTAHHVAKAEKDDPSRIVTIDTVAVWAGALGYQLVLMPVPLPPTTLSAIERSREIASTRIRDRP